MKENTCFICRHQWLADKKNKTFIIRQVDLPYGFEPTNVLFSLLEGINETSYNDDLCNMTWMTSTTLIPNMGRYKNNRKYAYIRYRI
jgi:hypothetical protein